VSQATDPIELEILRSRLEAVGDQAAAAVEHTAITPAVTEAKDYSVTLLDADGGLIVGKGMVLFHFGAARHAVRSTIARFGETNAPGDVFLSNDPHNGGGLHPQDVVVQRPIFVGGRRVAWVAISAHLIDMGGLVVGSFAPAAEECFQEAFRIPPLRIFRAGVEVSEVFDLLRTNVRMADLVEMDLRGLVAGCHLASERLEPLIASVGVDDFVASMRALRDLTEAEMRRRISLLEDGTYRTTSWTEFDREFHELPCALTVDGERLIFDYAGAAPQTRHFFNSKPYIVESELAVMLAWRLAQDLPFNEGIFAPIELRCPERSIVNASPPAPISAAHMHVALNAADLGQQAVVLALAASPRAPQRRWLSGPGFESSIGLQVWSWTQPDGSTDAYVVQDGNWSGGSAGSERDGTDLGRNLVGPRIEGSFQEIEIMESWYPLLFTERRARRSAGGAGRQRAGGGCQLAFRPHGVAKISGSMFGMRRWLPLQGMAGGAPGPCNEFLVHRLDGSVEQVEICTSGIEIAAGERFEMRLPGGGGYGDPLERDPDAVIADVAEGRFSQAEAERIYGVVAGDARATQNRRAELRTARLSGATPPRRPIATADAERLASGDPIPLYPGVVQRGRVAFAQESGAPLAISPDHWSDGCPVLIERRWRDGPPVVFRSYLDPRTGRALYVEVALENSPRTFEMSPRRWTDSPSRS
jgi:N-methylhydantoinase B